MRFFSYFALVLEETKAENWRDARVVEEARLESVYTPKVYRGFESRSLRKKYKQETISKYNNNNLIN